MVSQKPDAFAEWSREKPTQPGWYWWRMSEHTRTAPVEIAADEDGVFWKLGPGSPKKADHGEWLGPLTPKSAKAAWEAGVRAAAEKCKEQKDTYDLCVAQSDAAVNKDYYESQAAVAANLERSILSLLAADVEKDNAEN